MIGVVRNPGELIHLRKADGPLAMLCDVEPRANQTTGRETVTP